MKRTGPTNPHLRRLITQLEIAGRKHAPIWKRVAELLSRPTRKIIAVNVSKFNRVKGEIFVVPGVVLGGGRLTRAVTVAAYRFTPAARRKIKEAGGRAISIEELIESNTKGSNVVIIA